MTELDTSRPHVVTAPHAVPYSAMWVGFCTCGAEFTGTSAEEVRAAGEPHRVAEKERTGVLADQTRIESRQRRIQAGRAQRRSRANGRGAARG